MGEAVSDIEIQAWELHELTVSMLELEEAALLKPVQELMVEQTGINQPFARMKMMAALLSSNVRAMAIVMSQSNVDSVPSPHDQELFKALLVVEKTAMVMREALGEMAVN